MLGALLKGADSTTPAIREHIENASRSDRVKRVRVQRLEEAETIRAVCRVCGSRTEMGREALAGLGRAGVATVDKLRQLAYCEACEHAGAEAQKLRFHVIWRDPALNTIRLVPDGFKSGFEEPLGSERKLSA